MRKHLPFSSPTTTSLIVEVQHEDRCFTTPCSNQTDVASNAVLDTSNEDISASPLSHVFSDVEDDSVVDHSKMDSENVRSCSPEIQKIDHSPTTESSVKTPLVSTIGAPTSVSRENCKSMITLDSGPHQPTHFNFPQREFGQKKYRFQASWFQKWPWLHYVEHNDTVLCHTCACAAAMELPSTEKGELSFVKTGFSGWKKATESEKGFSKHENSTFHKNATSMLETALTTKDIAEQLSSQHEAEKLTRRKNLLKILSSVRYLARQGLPLRGDGDDKNSNFYRLLVTRGEDDPELLRWIEQKHGRKYISHEMQNEMLKVMALQILREVAARIQRSTFFSIMADETTDMSNREQLVICLRWVDDDLVPHEDFIGMQKVERIDAETIKSVILDVLVRMNLAMQKCRGQCYDGCSTMAGRKGGVAAMIKEIEPRALFTHCYGHALNLACADTIKQCKVVKEALETTHEISKLVKCSPKRDAQLQTLKDNDDDEDVPGSIRRLCPTRWTVRAESMQSIIDNYQQLKALWEWSLEEYKESEPKIRIEGVQARMKKFDFFFGLTLGSRILRHADSLSATLQMKDLSACEAQELAEMTVKTLNSIRNDESFKLFWQRVLQEPKSRGVNEPQLPRKRRAPKRIEECIGGTAQPEYQTSVEDNYRMIYYEALDLVTSCITHRFDQQDHLVHSACESLLLKAVNGDDFHEDISAVVEFYGSDFSRESLSTHLEILGTNFEREGQVNIHDIFVYCRGLTPAKRALMSEAIKLVKLLLTMPARNASSERAFSTLRYIKNYLRTTMFQERLNHLIVLYVHKENLDRLDLSQMA